MIYLVGTILIAASVILSLLSVGSYILTIRGNRSALTYGRVGVYGSLVMVVTLWFFMVALFLAHRFDIDYVNSYSSLDLTALYTIAATWGGQPGSFAIWGVFSAISAAFLVRRTRHFEPYVLTVYMVIQTGLLALMFISNPFKPLMDPATGMLAQMPTDGQGLNPLLHNFWMILHPPVLFVGYALAAVPLAFALGGLLRHDYDGWVTRALPWAVAAWAFLGLALLLGAYWAYETLGWGGYWGWDPVENSSLVPWLMLTALLHGMLVQHVHGGGLRRSNVIMAILSYIAVLYASFLTRSGVLSNFSVHSFVAEGLREVMLAYLGVIGILSFIILALRWFDIPTKALSTKFFSRDSFSVLAILTLVLLAVVVSGGTSMPVISAVPGLGHSLQEMFGSSFTIDDGSALGGEPLEDGRFSLARDFYERTTPPLGIVLVGLLIFSPLLDWRDMNPQRVVRGLRWPFVAGVVGTVVAILLGVRDALSLFYIGLGIVATGPNLLLLIRTVRSGWMRIGGYLAHVGFCIMLLGIVGSTVYATPDERIILSTGEKVSIHDMDITFNQWESTPDGKGVLNLTVQRGGSTFNALPQLYFDQRMGSTMSTPSIKSYLLHDLYLSPVEYVRENNPNEPVLQRGQAAVVGPYQITFDNFQVDEHAFTESGVAEVGAKLMVLYEGKEYEITPSINLTPKENAENPDEPFERIPATLPGGHTILLKLFDPGQMMVQLTVEGLNLPVKPAQVVITVSLKPAIGLVWVGVIVNVLGGAIAVYRRYREGQGQLREQRATLPQSSVEA